jgi:cellulose synthase/poly-beta-1,6-N-acetylglucosamine synthase-like glycosyltransferase
MTPSDWFMQVLIFIIVAYPIVGGCAFIVSSAIYHLFMERRDRPRYLEHGEPFVTILVPAHNEEGSIESTVQWLENRLNYPAGKYEIIVIDDASTDQTALILARLQREYPDNLRVITIVKNRGKAHAFNIALGYAKGDFLLSNDADTKPNPNALWQYLSYFERAGGQNVGAVTGNMLAANRAGGGMAGALRARHPFLPRCSRADRTAGQATEALVVGRSLRAADQIWRSAQAPPSGISGCCR